MTLDEKKPLADSAWTWIVLFWGALALDGYSTWLAVQPHGGGLDYETNPMLRGADWPTFVWYLLVVHLLMQACFAWAWPRRLCLRELFTSPPGMERFSWRMFLRFATIHIPDRIQLVYTALTLYLAVTIAHLAATVNNAWVALGGRGAFGWLEGKLGSSGALVALQSARGWAIVLFYTATILLGILFAHLWFVWRLGESHRELGLLSTLFSSLSEKSYRVLGCCFFSLMAVQKIFAYSNYANRLLWLLETAIFVFLASFYALRRSPLARAQGFAETVVPLVGGMWPFLLLFQRRSSFGLVHQNEILMIMCAGTALAVWGYAHLRDSFSIMVEARELKRTGPYRFVRHPIYAGQLVTAMAVTVWRFSWANLVLCLFFVALQTYRASLEEKKLIEHCADYRDYRSETAMFLPGIL